MCGIAGIYRFDRQPVPGQDVAALEAMAAIQHHRGPDAGGQAVLGCCALASQRLRDVKELAPMEEASQEILKLVRRPKLTIEASKQYIGLNEKFHTALLDLSRSRMLRRSVEQACSLPFASPGAFLERQFISDDLHELFLISADQHCSIVEAIASRDGLRAEMLTREHAQVARRNLEDALKNRERIPGLGGIKLVSV